MSMNMASSTNGMGMMSGMGASATSMTASPTGGMDMGGMGGMSGMGGDSDCKVSMLWNWYTVDACFLSTSWHVKSSGAFAGSCIGVIALVLMLEALRRVAREYDAYLTRTKSRALATTVMTGPSAAMGAAQADDSSLRSKTDQKAALMTPTVTMVRPTSFTPSLHEQLIRAFLHMAQFAVAYIVMLLAMYFNGYIIICIFIGAFVGAFLFGWHSMPLASSAS